MILTNLKYKKDIWLGEKVVIGENCKIQPFVFIPDGVTIENNVFIGPGTVFTNDKRPPSGGKHWAETLVRDGAVIGANCTILPGVVIGKGSIVGAGAVVTKDIPDGETWVGNPARKFNKKLNWAVIGDKGFVAQRHIKTIEELGDKVTMSWDKEVDYKEAIKLEEWENVDAVAICTPNCFHYPMSKAMEDKIVICEKPLCLSSDEVLNLNNNVNAVLQLRYHPEVIKWKEKLSDKVPHICKLTVKMFRDDKYWNSWKGDNSQSGGILFNLGIHYFDLLIHLFGEKYEIIGSVYSDKRCTGIIDFDGVDVEYLVEILPEREGQVRKFEIDGEEVVLSIQDNLAYEGLHTELYKDVKDGKGIKPKEALKSIKLVEKLCQKEHNAKNV